jgi:hypothetical protein
MRVVGNRLERFISSTAMSSLACVSLHCVDHHPVARLRLVLRFPLSLFPGGRPLVALALFVSTALFPEDGTIDADGDGTEAAAVASSSPALTGEAAAEVDTETELVAAIVAGAEEELSSTVVRLVAVFEVAVSRHGRFCPTTVGALVQRFVPLLPPEVDGCTLGNDEEGGGGGRGPEWPPVAAAVAASATAFFLIILTPLLRTCTWGATGTAPALVGG